MRRIALALIAAGALAAGTLAAGTLDAGASRATPPTCSLRHSTTLAADALVRVYSVAGFVPAAQVDGTLIYGCVKASGRRAQIGERYDDQYVYRGTFSRLLLRGAFAASLQSSTDISCKAGCPPGYRPTSTWVQLDALALRRRRRAPLEGRLLSSGLLLTRGGTAAWLDGAAGAARLELLTVGGARTADRGAIAPASLTLSDSTLAWRNAGRQMSMRVG